MRHLLLGSALAAAALTACYTGPHVDGFLPAPMPEPTTSSDPTEPAAAGLPCDVQQILRDNCTSCHGTKLQEGATVRLLTYDDLTSEYEGRVVASLALERMRDADKPMPPQGALADDPIAAFEQWILKDMPADGCGDVATGDDDDSAPPPAVQTTCTSGTHWTRGNHGSSLMKPGAACIHCHATGSTTSDDGDGEVETGPLFFFAGTVYPAAHDEDDCNGSDAGATTKVVLTGADGQVVQLPINQAGNFYSRASLAMPVKAQVVSAAGTRTMKAAVKDGDCNKCHTATSASPGRIVEKR